MSAFRQYEAIVGTAGSIRVDETDFAPGEKVRVYIERELTQEQRQALSEELQSLVERIMAEREGPPLTDAEIQAEIEAHRRGE